MNENEKLDRAITLCKAYNRYHSKDYVVRKVHSRIGISTNPYIITYRISPTFPNSPIVYNK